MYFIPWLNKQTVIPKSSWTRWDVNQFSTGEMVYNAVHSEQLFEEIAAQKKNERTATANNTLKAKIAALAEKLDDYNNYGANYHIRNINSVVVEMRQLSAI